MKKLGEVTETWKFSIRIQNDGHSQSYIKEIHNYLGKKAMLKQDNTCKSSENALKVHIWVHLLEDEVPKDDT